MARAAKQLKKKRILLVEDEKPISQTLELKLTKSGFDVVCAYDGVECLSCIAGESFDLVLLDLVMPEKDGFTVLEELRGKKRPPIIVLTNLGQEEDAERCKDLGADDYFVKADTPLVTIVERISALFSSRP